MIDKLQRLAAAIAQVSATKVEQPSAWFDALDELQAAALALEDVLPAVIDGLAAGVGETPAPPKCSCEEMGCTGGCPVHGAFAPGQIYGPPRVGETPVPPPPDPFCLDEWRALPEVCLFSGCEHDGIDQRGPVWLRDGSMHKACTDHWEPIMRILGEQSSWTADGDGPVANDEPVSQQCGVAGPKHAVCNLPSGHAGSWHEGNGYDAWGPMYRVWEAKT